MSWSFYVNASKINSCVRKNGVAYIAAQLPSQHSVGHFWQMIWEGNIELIIMIVKDIDEECPYWSEQSNKMKEDDSIKVVRFTEETLPEPGLIRRVIWISDGETEK